MSTGPASVRQVETSNALEGEGIHNDGQPGCLLVVEGGHTEASVERPHGCRHALTVLGRAPHHTVEVLGLPLRSGARAATPPTSRYSTPWSPNTSTQVRARGPARGGSVVLDGGGIVASGLAFALQLLEERNKLLLVSRRRPSEVIGTSSGDRSGASSGVACSSSTLIRTTPRAIWVQKGSDCGSVLASGGLSAALRRVAAVAGRCGSAQPRGRG